MQDSDSEEGGAKAAREDILAVGEVRLGPCDEAMRSKLFSVSDLGRLKRMLLRAVTAASWYEIVEAP